MWKKCECQQLYCVGCELPHLFLYKPHTHPLTAWPPKRTMLPAQKVAAVCSRGVGVAPSVLGLYHCLGGDEKEASVGHI